MSESRIKVISCIERQAAKVFDNVRISNLFYLILLLVAFPFGQAEQRQI